MTDFMSVIAVFLIYYPVLLDKGFSLSRVPVLVLKSRESWSKILSDIGTLVRCVASTDSIEDLKKILTTENSIGIALEIHRKTQQKTQKYAEMMDIMLDAVYHHRCGSHTVTCVPMLLSWGLPEDDLVADSFLIFAEDGGNSGIGLQDLLPSPGKELDLVLTNEFAEVEGMARLLNEAVWMIRSEFERKGKLEIYTKLQSAVLRMVALDENARSSEGLSDLFINDLRKWVRREHPEAIILQNGLDNEIQNPQETLFFRNDSLLLSKEAFETILQPMGRRSIPYHHVKEALRHAGVLQCEEAGTYQVKIRFGKDGVENVRGYKLALNRLDDPDNGFRVLDCCRRYEGGIQK